MWVPMAVSAVALCAALTGVAQSGNWKLLLVVPVGMVLSEMVGLVSSLTEWRTSDDGLYRMYLAMCAKQGRQPNWPAFSGLIDCVVGGFMSYVTVLFPLSLLERFTRATNDWRWVTACLLVGCACVPWCYWGKDGDERFRKWMIFAFTAIAAVVLVAFPCVGFEWVGFAALVIPVVLVVRRKLILNNEKGRIGNEA